MRSPHVKESGFRNKRIFFLVESGVLYFGIRNTAPEIRNPTIQVSLKKKTEFTAWNSLARIQDCLGFPYNG